MRARVGASQSCVGHHNRHIAAGAKHTATLLGWLGMRLRADKQLRQDEHADGDRFGAMFPEPTASRTVTPLPAFPDDVYKEGGVEVDHQTGTRTGS